MLQFLVICEGRYTKTFSVLLFSLFCFALLFYLCALFCALLFCVFYVSLHYVLPALQFNCACLIFMNMYVLLVSVCKCIVYVFI